MVFCFQGNRVFVSCMDDECRRGFECNGESFVIASRVIEETGDMLSRGCNKFSSSRRIAWNGTEITLHSMCSQRSLNLLSDRQVRCLVDERQKIATNALGSSSISKVPWRCVVYDVALINAWLNCSCLQGDTCWG